MKCSILNIGAGKLRGLEEFRDYINDEMDYFIIHLDPNYLNGVSAQFAEHEHEIWFKENGKKELNVNEEIFEFLESYLHTFDFILIYRFFEHLSRDKLLYFIYLLSTITESLSLVDIISPDYGILGKMIAEENVYDPNFDKNDIILSTEIFNEISDPHKNITTPNRLKRLFKYEDRFVPYEEFKNYNFDGRNIYFRSIFRRI